MEIEKLFNAFNEVNEKLDGEILEISVKQHQITISMKNSLIKYSSINNICGKLEDYDKAYITTYKDVLYLTIEGLSDLSPLDIFYPFMFTINVFAENICKCPSLEYTISSQYIKCYLDKPGLKLADLCKYEELLLAEEKGELEMHPQRPYLLFINENYEG